VLENGPSSPCGDFFDVDWAPVKAELKGKVLLPVLGGQYGRVLDRGELQLEFVAGALHLRYFDLDLPQSAAGARARPTSRPSGRGNGR
jgi:(1->4)-alpha-D-glucan 1-alpha-D-glucosylmutase